MNQRTKQIVGRHIAAFLILNLVVFFGAGERVDENQTFGMIMFWATSFNWSLFLFWKCGLTYSRISNKRISYNIARAAVVLALLQIPTWCIITQEFPLGNLSTIQALLFGVGMLFSLFAPAAPWISSFVAHLVVVNAEQHRQIQTKKSNKTG